MPVYALCKLAITAPDGSTSLQVFTVYIVSSQLKMLLTKVYVS